MGTINYTSEAYVNGIDFETGEVSNVKKIQLTDIPVVGTITVDRKQTDYQTMNYQGTEPVFDPALTADITITYLPVMVDYSNPLKLPRVEFDSVTNKYYAKFSVHAQGNFVYNMVTYAVNKRDDVVIELIIDDLKDPVFDSELTFVPQILSSDGKVDYTDQLPKYRFTVETIVINVSGKATVFVPLVTKT